ncbi:uncharacterized protein LOC118478720 isoform X2 [Aplysia californica]|uniref:Uncharacterized protein LOC118478720 isoform X2 n=1 Tax=Aplysia californica TaxID=6500 RepID=A0ABM1W254_APLCA|nr:uncharacterized protein LOC118478720 isoform X2 [Aplysia californica]
MASAGTEGTRKFSTRLLAKKKRRLVENKQSLGDTSVQNEQYTCEQFLHSSCHNHNNNGIHIHDTDTVGKESASVSAGLQLKSKAFLDSLQLKPVQKSDAEQDGKIKPVSSKNESDAKHVEKILKRNASSQHTHSKRKKQKLGAGVTLVKLKAKSDSSESSCPQSSSSYGANPSSLQTSKEGVDSFSDLNNQAKPDTDEQPKPSKLSNCSLSPNNNTPLTITANVGSGNTEPVNEEAVAHTGSKGTTYKVITFRDVNKTITVTSDGEATEDVTVSSSKFFSEVDANASGRKRRYAKLMKKLVDAEKSLDTNLKAVVPLSEDNEDKSEDFCVDKMKNKLCLREKKKYERLINYQRDQSKEDQKSFMDILPEKVEQVKANVVRQLVSRSEAVIENKRPRGRPRKDPQQKVPKIEEKKNVLTQRQRKRKNKGQLKQKDIAANRGFPVKFPKSLLQDPKLKSLRQSRVYENESGKFRLGIVGKDGEQEFMELSSDTLKGLYPQRSAQKSNVIGEEQRCKKSSASTHRAASETTQNLDGEERSENVSTLNQNSVKRVYRTEDGEPIVQPERITGAQSMKEDSWLKSRPLTITLPSISALENEYELVSLSPSSNAEKSRAGNMKIDQFYIPQSTFLKDGKTSMIIVGPFLVVSEPKPHLALVCSDNQQKGPPMILTKKLCSPGSTPPRDFRLKKESARGYDSKIVTKQPAGVKGDPETALIDHDYCTPPELRDTVKKHCKGVARQYANAKFIDVRLENITEEEGLSLVTIRGHNVLQQAKSQVNEMPALMRNNEEGIPVVYNLSQVMTPALKGMEMRAERERMVQESRQSGDYSQVFYPYSAMGDVVMEVLIPPAGNEFVPRNRLKKAKEHSSAVAAEGTKNTGGEVSAGNLNFVNTSNVIDLDLERSPELGGSQTDKMGN